MQKYPADIEVATKRVIAYTVAVSATAIVFSRARAFTLL